MRNIDDYFGVDASRLKKKKLWLFDMDGTIYKDGKVIAGTKELLGAIKNKGGKYVFITNNSSKSVADYIEYVNGMGLEGDESNFFTSAQAAILYIKKYIPNSTIYCQGTKSFLKELRDAGLTVTDKVEPVDVVLVGFDTELTTNKLRNTCEILSTQDVSYIATNQDLACPAWFGFVPDCGAICNMIAAATGKKPRYMGKPEPLMVNEVRHKFGYDLEDTVIVGDRLYTDIATGLNANVSSICVLTGEATIEEIGNTEYKPDFTFDSVMDIARILGNHVEEMVM